MSIQEEFKKTPASRQFERISKIIKNNPVSVQGNNGSGKSRLVRSLIPFFDDSIVYNDTRETYQIKRGDIKNISSTHELLIFEDFDNLFQKTEWNLKENRELLAPIQKRECTCRQKSIYHRNQTLIFISRFNRIYVGIMNNLVVNIYVRRITKKLYQYDIFDTTFQTFHSFYINAKHLKGTHEVFA